MHLRVSRRNILRLSLVIGTISVLVFSAFTYLGISASSHTAKAAGPNFNKVQKRLISGVVSSEIYPQQAQTFARSTTNYYPHRGDACGQSFGNNIKVNQNCINLSDPDLAGRGQANNETAIAVNPNNPNQVVASDNDYRRGDGTCGIAYSQDGGRHWNDGTTPNSFTRGTAFGGFARQYWQAGGDTEVAWDSKNNAYLLCQVFNRGHAVSSNPDLSSAVYVLRSTQNGGASWNFTARPVVEFYDPTGTLGALEDKPFFTVDNHSGSPFQDRIYVSYTEFAPDGTGYIWLSYSDNYGESFSPRVLVSKDSPFCTNTFGLPTPQGACNENQFSQPFTGPDGALYVAYANFNNSLSSTLPEPDVVGDQPTDNRSQMLLVKSTDGGKTFSNPVKVADYYDLPDCAEYQGGADPGRACVPEKGATTNSIFRATNYPVGAVNPRNKNQVVVTFGSYINKHSNESNGCVPAGFSEDALNLFTGVKTPGACNNDIVLSVSNDAGASFTGGKTDPRDLDTVNTSSGQATSDQFWQWATFSSSGRLVVSYYDRQYDDDETTGFSDISLSASDGHTFSRFATRRVTSGSMPPATQFSGQFFGDYITLDVNGNTAHPVWMDTRNPEFFLCPNTGQAGKPPAICTASAPNAKIANDQDMFTASVELP